MSETRSQWTELPLNDCIVQLVEPNGDTQDGVYELTYDVTREEFPEIRSRIERWVEDKPHVKSIVVHVGDTRETFTYTIDRNAAIVTCTPCPDEGCMDYQLDLGSVVSVHATREELQRIITAIQTALT